MASTGDTGQKRTKLHEIVLPNWNMWTFWTGGVWWVATDVFFILLLSELEKTVKKPMAIENHRKNQGIPGWQKTLHSIASNPENILERLDAASAMKLQVAFIRGFNGPAPLREKDMIPKTLRGLGAFGAKISMVFNETETGLRKAVWKVCSSVSPWEMGDCWWSSTKTNQSSWSCGSLASLCYSFLQFEIADRHPFC